MKKPFLNKKMLQNWFGDRGEQIKKSWIKEWFVKGDYLYLQWTDKAPSYFQPDKPFDINWLNWKSHYFEFYDEGYLIDEIKENENG